MCGCWQVRVAWGGGGGDAGARSCWSLPSAHHCSWCTHARTENHAITPAAEHLLWGLCDYAAKVMNALCRRLVAAVLVGMQGGLLMALVTRGGIGCMCMRARQAHTRACTHTHSLNRAQAVFVSQLWQANIASVYDRREAALQKWCVHLADEARRPSQCPKAQLAARTAQPA